MFAAANCFPDFSHFDIQGVKIHAGDNLKARPLLKDVHVELKTD